MFSNPNRLRDASFLALAGPERAAIFLILCQAPAEPQRRPVAVTRALGAEADEDDQGPSGGETILSRVGERLRSRPSATALGRA